MYWSRRRLTRTGLGGVVPLFQAANSATLVWPAEEVFFKEGSVNHAYYVPSRAVTNIHELFILFVDHRMWDMKSFKWRSPLWQDSQFPKANRNHLSCMEVVAMPTDQVSKPCLALAAEMGFWQITKQGLQQWARLLGINPGTLETFDLLFQMVKVVLKCDDEKALKCCSHRLKHMVKQRDALSVIANDTELGNTAFDPSDHADIKKDLDKAKEKKNAAKVFKQSFKEKAKEVRVKLELAKPNAKKRSRKSHEVKSIQVPNGVPTQPQAKALIPPESSIWRSHSDSGWCGHLEPFSRSHYSGIMYGERGACLWQIKDLWTKYAILTGQEVEDLLPKQIQDELEGDDPAGDEEQAEDPA